MSSAIKPYQAESLSRSVLTVSCEERGVLPGCSGGSREGDGEDAWHAGRVRLYRMGMGGPEHRTGPCLRVQPWPWRLALKLLIPSNPNIRTRS